MAIRRDLGDKETTLEEIDMLIGHIVDIGKRLDSQSVGKSNRP